MKDLSGRKVRTKTTGELSSPSPESSGGSSGRSSGGLLANVFGLYRQVKQHSNAADKAREVYDEGGTLEEVLRAAARRTDEPADDRVIDGSMETILRVRNVLGNIGQSLYAIAYEFEDLARAIDEVVGSPLKDVLETKEKEDDAV